MSDSPEHPHDHDHHPGDGHRHDHDHDHDDPAASPTGGVLADDAGTEALSNALKSSFAIVQVIMGILVVVFLFSGVFKVDPHQQAVVFRFGKVVGEPDHQLLGPGLHWSFPAPIDEVQKISIGEIQSVRSTVGWYAVTPEYELAGKEPDGRPSLIPMLDGYALTADGNIIHVRATIRYRITDPGTYIFSFANASNLMLNAVNNAILRSASEYTVDQALRLDAAGFKDRIFAHVNEQVTAHKLGVTLELADVIVAPPLFVKPAFNEVLAAEQDRDNKISQARGYATSLITLAQSDASSVISRGETDRIQLLQSLKAEAHNFTNYLAVFEKNPKLYTQLLLVDSWQRVLTNADEKYFGESRQTRLLLNRALKPPLARPTR